MDTFKELNLNPQLLQAVEDLGFTTPTEIQQQAIPHILGSETDLIALAQTGSGKTAAFGLPILEKLDFSQKEISAIILCPTRELCLQISKDLDTYSVHSERVRVLAVYGGTDIKNQIRDLKKNPQIVVGTPGRTLDLIRRGNLKIDKVKWVVLDEADEMLNMGFREDIDMILEDTPAEKQTLLFSATMPDDVRRIASRYMNSPEEITIGKKNQGATDVKHEYYMVRASDRYPALKRIVDYNPDVYGIIFCRTRREAKDVAAKLIQDGYNADALHGDLSQAQRDTVMEKFRKGVIQLLVATDVAARGIDVNNLTHVINYNLPDDPEVYVHRSGRTGRAGHKGTSAIIVHSREGRRIKELEKMLRKTIERKPVPQGEEIVEKRLFNTIDKIEKTVVDEEQIAPYMETINKKLAWMDRDELLKRFVSTEFNAFLDYYKNSGDLNISGSERSKSERSRRPDMTRFFIAKGRKEKLKPVNLIGLINDVTRKSDIDIGQIEILNNFSFFEADSQYEKLILDSFAKENIGVEVANPDTHGGNRERKKKKGYDNDFEYSRFGKKSGRKGRKGGSSQFGGRRSGSKSGRRGRNRR